MLSVILAAVLSAGATSSAPPAPGVSSILSADFSAGVVLNLAKGSVVPSNGGTLRALNWTQLVPALGAGNATLSITVNGVAVCSMAVPCTASAPTDFRCPAAGSATCPGSSTCALGAFDAGDDIDVKFTATACTLAAFPGGVASIEWSAQ